MHHIKIGITGWGSVSPLGVNGAAAWEQYQNERHCCIKMDLPGGAAWASPLSAAAQAAAFRISNENSKYRRLDPTVWYAIAASRSAVEGAGWKGVPGFGINIGSSRGATTLFEKYHAQFMESGGQSAEPLASPSTTLGNIASWTASDLNATGPVISHSITCSTALHAIINAFMWLKAGACTRFLAGGSEAPLTPFTLAQMKALKVYSAIEEGYPCRSMDLEKDRNTMILGEGAASFCLEASPEPDRTLACISGIGYGTEPLSHGASLSADALCLQRSMKMALKGHDPESVNAVVLHAPGTIRGDAAEIEAVKAVFGRHRPLLTSNKWKIGHTFGASGALSLEMALLMLMHDRFIPPPYLDPTPRRGPLKKILVNGVGFGGNAASVLIEK